MSAYQVFCKEYRVTIVADHPGIGKDITDLSFSYFPFSISEVVQSIQSVSRQLLSIVLEEHKSHSCLSSASHFRFLSSVTPSIKERISFLLISLTDKIGNSNSTSFEAQCISMQLFYFQDSTADLFFKLPLGMELRWGNLDLHNIVHICLYIRSCRGEKNTTLRTWQVT